MTFQRRHPDVEIPFLVHALFPLHRFTGNVAMFHMVRLLSLIALVLTAAIFGFFFAWVCSTMWGLDQAEPPVAIAAMQAMNASVRNAVFAPAFFGTPIVLVATACACWLARQRPASLLFLSAAVVYASGGVLLTMLVNVPMNDALAMASIPEDSAEAARIWQSYSAPWQTWNAIRTVASGVALALVGAALLALPPSRAP